MTDAVRHLAVGGRACGAVDDVDEVTYVDIKIGPYVVVFLYVTM